jgi:uncharacterized protein (DUF2236 family)
MSPTEASGADGRYAAAAGLVERAAAAQSSAVPADPADDGFFGPGSVAWRLSGDLSAIIAGLRALLVQALHPLAMAGVDQHSNWRQDPVGRLAATTGYTATVTFGDRAAAERAAGIVRRIHERVRGTDPQTGRPYAASDPALLLWVHAGLVDSVIAACDMFGAGLSPQDADRYVAEMAIAAELLGVPGAQVFRDAAGLAAYLAATEPELAVTPAALEACAYLLDPPGLDPDIGEIWQDIRDGAVAALPPWAAARYGMAAPPLTPARREEIRQALGVLDVVYLGEPGVLEARQRIALRMRAARPA